MTLKQMNSIARLTSSGLNSTFNFSSGSNGHVKRVTVESGTSRLVLNGYFTSFNGTSCGNMVRLHLNDLNASGQVDPSFNIGTGADDRVWNAFAQASDGSYVVMGAYESFNGSPRQCLASLGNDGTLNPTKFASFTIGMSLALSQCLRFRKGCRLN